MGTVQGVIDLIRDEFFDTAKTIKDEPAARLVRRAVERANASVKQYNIQFGKRVHTLQTVPGVDLYDLPADFDAPDGLFRLDTHCDLKHYSDTQWELVTSTAELRIWRIVGNKIQVAGKPVQIVNLNLYYWPHINTSGYVSNLESVLPWEGKLDTILADYCILILKSRDEHQDVSIYADIERDMEEKIYRKYSSLVPNMESIVGSYCAR